MVTMTFRRSLRIFWMSSEFAAELATTLSWSAGISIRFLNSPSGSMPVNDFDSGTQKASVTPSMPGLVFSSTRFDSMGSCAAR
ncbi:MAG: hypothetical protein JW395_0203 [Nitrospira sp.]|nr:hypothetical protein [Nitrospira sp.]